MKVLSGVHTTYDGDILVKGKTVKFKTTRDAENAGIAIIHQELNLIYELTVMENIFSWSRTKKNGCVDRL